MLCDLCQEREASVVRSVEISGKKTIVYRCDVCLAGKGPSIEDHTPPSLDRPCSKCRQEEGEVKWTRFINGRRVVTYLCQKCASA